MNVIRLRCLSLATTCLLTALGHATRSDAACELRQVAELEVHMTGNAPLIPASIDDHPVQLLVDTGAVKSMIWRSSAKEMNLAISEGNTKFYGAGGSETAGVVLIRNLTLAGASVHNLRLYAAGHGRSMSISAGILGEDLLSNWDVEFDLSNQKLRLFSPRGCKGGEVAYWAPAYSMMKLIGDPHQDGWLKANVQLNGRTVVALLDTGAWSSVVSIQAVNRAGIRPETAMEAAPESRGIAGKTIETRVAIFPSLSIGEETVRNAKLRIADLFSANAEVVTGSLIPQQVVDNPDMLLGADFFLSHRVYVARSQQAIYFTYKGGPIFRPLAPRTVEQSGTAPNPDPPPATTESADAPNP